jgi:hypothetical protein
MGRQIRVVVVVVDVVVTVVVDELEVLSDE